ncbi:hypothetical protein GCM10008986_00470 [Salinibacillus aidingensis]|uniref:Calcineurin-like phosphoesterase domain-containing protein n=1 Tax=Salinibacillus aidingensis TaxID=237684 RepID=A0ABP3KH77_9BACI
MFRFLKPILISILILCLALFPFATEAKQDQSETISVKLLGVNDFHGQLESMEKGDKRLGGAPYLASYLHQYQMESDENTLLVHAGDAVGNSPPISAFLQDEPTIEFLNRTGFDAGTVGNHEFDEGLTELKRLIYGGHHEKTGYFQGADFPYTVANVIDKKTGKPILPPYIIKKVQGVPIGIIGVVTTDTKSRVDEEHVRNLEFKSITDSLNQTVEELKEKGVKTIVVLAHASANSKKDGSKPSGKIPEISPELDDEIDVIFAGHNHKYANTVVDNKLIIQAYSKGKAFSEVDLQIDPLTGDVISKKGKVIKTFHKGIKPHPQLKEFVNELKLIKHVR